MSFDAAYRQPEPAPWDIGAPQPEIVRLADAGHMAGSVVDIGCGTGENALFLASRGHDVLGVDSAPTAVDQARSKASERGSAARFVHGDVLDLSFIERSFDTAIDVGCFHVFGDDDRPRYVASVGGILRASGRLHLLCFSDAQPGQNGPRRLSEGEIRTAFAAGWVIEEIRAARFATLLGPEGAQAWSATLRKI